MYRITKILFHRQSITVDDSIQYNIEYADITGDHFKSFWYGIILKQFDPCLSFRCCTKHSWFMDFGCWKQCRPMYSVCYSISYWHDAANLFSKSQYDKMTRGWNKTWNLQQETNLLQKIAHHNNAHHPCPSKHQRSFFGEHTIQNKTLMMWKIKGNFITCKNISFT